MIHIINDYYVDIDNYGNNELKLDLHRVSIDKKTNEETQVYKTLGYYSSMRGACYGIIKHMSSNKANEKEIIEFEEYINIVNDTRKEVLDILNKINL